MNTYVEKRPSAEGLNFVEVLVAAAATAIVSGAVLTSMGEAQPDSPSGQNHTVAGAIAQQLVDDLRRVRYDVLTPGTYTWHLPSTPTDSGRSLLPRALHFDGGLLNARAKAVVKEGTGMFAGMRRLSVEINWDEGNQERSYAIDTSIGRHGLRS